MNYSSQLNLKGLLILAAVLGLSSCHIDKSKPNFELIQDMMESPTIKAQEYDAGSPNNAGARVPPEGTQPRGFTPYAFANDLEGAKNNPNPLKGDFSEDTLKIGQKYYTIHCQICHGAKGEGGEKMSVAEKMALKPPAVVSDKIKAWTDGQLYHVITMGQGVMGAYASHIPQDYRWQVVQYIRHLEGKE